jgi:hypothetical protein
MANVSSLLETMAFKNKWAEFLSNDEQNHLIHADEKMILLMS